MLKGRRKSDRHKEADTNSDRALGMPPAVLSPRTLQLFTTATSDATEEHRGDDSATMQKNPRWLASREKEVKSEALRDKMLALITDIEAEEDRDNPALKKAWLRAKKLELQRTAYKQPDEILAAEQFFRRARRKLREAQRRRRSSSGGGGGGGGGSQDGSDDDDVDDENDSDAESGKKPGAAAAKATRSWTVSSASDAAKAASATARETVRSEDESTKSDGVFNLNPTGRIAKPNPRAKPLELTEENRKEGKKLPKSLERLNKVVRFPLESGYKLGRLIRKRREKANSARGGKDGSENSDSGEDEGTWGSIVRSELATRGNDNNRDEARSGSNGGDSRSSHSRSTRSHSDSRGGRSSRSSSSSSSSSAIADIPVLQESVGKRIRDKLSLRRRQKAGGDDGADDLPADSGSDRDPEGAGGGAKSNKKKKKEKKDKEKKDKEKKDKEKKDKEKKDKEKKDKEKKDKEKKETRSKAKPDKEKEKPDKKSKSGGEEKNGSKRQEASGRSDQGADTSRRESQTAPVMTGKARSTVNEPIQFVELEDGID